ncbi:uncharacterized protein BO66DRAFT_84182 [Aspergillus aculeatinus CBS 121060]|uniref:Uncharacterized protein n=1 Tax=Aspergillus aculeatinus CBS 121060 TaxID=1448322 RepID=A0ACD1HB21_9EURO|nr:hypothetical protein BO66DRAFT_84182 [Aspergillus aculeatinus CBS 121060]RAH70618.1 hypothetical protein BO66DRAFT_84182 [Aspergillus aculeatinus CBS 121060]
MPRRKKTNMITGVIFASSKPLGFIQDMDRCYFILDPNTAIPNTPCKCQPSHTLTRYSKPKDNLFPTLPPSTASQEDTIHSCLRLSYVIFIPASAEEKQRGSTLHHQVQSISEANHSIDPNPILQQITTAHAHHSIQEEVRGLNKLNPFASEINPSPQCSSHPSEPIHASEG